MSKPISGSKNVAPLGKQRSSRGMMKVSFFRISQRNLVYAVLVPARAAGSNTCIYNREHSDRDAAVGLAYMQMEMQVSTREESRSALLYSPPLHICAYYPWSKCWKTWHQRGTRVMHNIMHPVTTWLYRASRTACVGITIWAETPTPFLRASGSKEALRRQSRTIILVPDAAISINWLIDIVRQGRVVHLVCEKQCAKKKKDFGRS